MGGREVQAEGIALIRDGQLNLASSDRRQCIGVLTHNVDPSMYPHYQGKRIQVTGLLMSDGCRDESVCQALCGPHLLINASVERRN